MVLPAGIPLTFSAGFNNPTPANVAISVYDDSGVSPVLVSGPTLMGEVNAYVYRGKFTGVAGKNYVVVMAVYTDGTFTTLNGTFPPVTTSFIAQNLNPPVQSVVGLVNCNGT